MNWLIFTILKPCFALGVWYGFDDRLAAHFDVPALGTVPWLLVFAMMLFISLSSEQYSIVRVMEWPKS